MPTKNREHYSEQLKLTDVDQGNFMVIFVV